MELIKNNWAKKDVIELNNYLFSLRVEEKRAWSKNILNTNMDVLALPTPIIKDISKQILKGNFLSLLDFENDEYYESTAINGYLITKIDDFNLMKRYLDIYSKKIDNWASCDLLSFNTKGKEELYFLLTEEYIKSSYPFQRRIGLLILFDFITNNSYIKRIFEILNSFYEETHYYVNMMIAWLFCECFIKRREETLSFLKSHKLNKFSINKGISKCRDSFRVSIEDKESLLKYKVK